MAINFIKNLSQLITGGIGIVDDELVYKDSEGNVRATGDFKEVEEIPESLDPGEIVLVTDPLAYGLWRGLKEGETGLAAGTPWPLKGYKEVVGTVNFDLAFNWDGSEIKFFPFSGSEFDRFGTSFSLRDTSLDNVGLLFENQIIGLKGAFAITDSVPDRVFINMFGFYSLAEGDSYTALYSPFNTQADFPEFSAVFNIGDPPIAFFEDDPNNWFAEKSDMFSFEVKIYPPEPE